LSSVFGGEQAIIVRPAMFREHIDASFVQDGDRERGGGVRRRRIEPSG
jgi:hypothetical protein